MLSTLSYIYFSWICKYIFASVEIKECLALVGALHKFTINNIKHEYKFRLYVNSDLDKSFAENINREM